MIIEKEKVDQMIKLSQNENPLGASPMALKAIEENIQNVNRYPDRDPEKLRAKLARKFHVETENVIVGGGSVEIIDMLIKVFVGFDKNVVTSEKTFIAYSLLSEINRRAYLTAPMQNNTFQIDNLLATCDRNTALVFIANPNNPTGTLIGRKDLEKLMNILPKNVVVVVDEAYAEYVIDPDYPDTISMLKSYPNLIVLRTFSKIYGLAGLRVGYAFAKKEFANLLNRSRTPFSVSSLGISAALRALDDDEFVEKCASINVTERKYLFDELVALGYNVTPSHGNFLLIEFNTIREKEETYEYLKANGIMVRPLDPFGIASGFRISVGLPEENRELIDCLKKISD